LQSVWGKLAILNTENIKEQLLVVAKLSHSQPSASRLYMCWYAHSNS